MFDIFVLMLLEATGTRHLLTNSSEGIGKSLQEVQLCQRVGRMPMPFNQGQRALIGLLNCWQMVIDNTRDIYKVLLQYYTIRQTFFFNTYQEPNISFKINIKEGNYVSKIFPRFIF
jgi:hypothetical protein